MEETFKQQLLYDLFQAYFDARKNKRHTINALKFEVNYESKLLQLHQDLVNQQYQIGKSIAFIVYQPVQREVFAADFRDRIVHHLIYNYINPVFEKRFIHDSYSCRTGKGTHYGIQRINQFIRKCSQNYSRHCYILKLDIQGYFMSINKHILYEKIEQVLLKEHYYHNRYSKGSLPAAISNKANLEWLLQLIRQIIMNDPTQNCTIKGSLNNWNGLPPTKSLFYAKPYCGLPIGNLTSQLFANIYLNEFDYFVKQQCKIKYYGRYVDDFVIIHPHKEYLKLLIPVLSKFLHSTLQLTLHPKKIYLQHYTKGVKFLGVKIKPYRIYISDRTKENFYRKIQYWNNCIYKNRNKIIAADLPLCLASINSYLGILKHYRTYKLRKKFLLKHLSAYMWNYFYISGGYSKLVPKIKRV